MYARRQGPGGGKGADGGGDSDEEMGSVHPTPDDIRYIRVCDDIPIAIFGVPLPIIEPTYVIK
jgi:hypothetical protein